MAIDGHDEMFEHLIPLFGSRRMAEAVYLEQGEGMVENLLAMLRSNGLALERAESVLDFACGHGRVTRWLVDTCGAERVTASDINPQAVDFVCKTLKVAGFYSTQEADDLTHDRKYKVIFVASLFSHLTLKHWNEWAAHLARMLQLGGFSSFRLTAWVTMRIIAQRFSAALVSWPRASSTTVGTRRRAGWRATITGPHTSLKSTYGGFFRQAASDA